MSSTQSFMQLETFRCFNRSNPYFLQTVNLIACCSKLSSLMSEVHFFPFMSQGSWPQILRVSSISDQRLKTVCSFELFFSLIPHFQSNLFFVRIIHNTFSSEFLSVKTGYRLMGSNLLIHPWLCKPRLINLIMTVFSEPNHIKHDILSISLPILDCNLTTS